MLFVRRTQNTIDTSTAWAALINTLSASGISDLPLTIIVLGFVLFGFVLGLFSFMRVGGIALLGVIGGMALGLRIIIVKDGLLISNRTFYFVNWIIVVILMMAGGAGVMVRQRVGIVSVFVSYIVKGVWDPYYYCVMDSY